MFDKANDLFGEEMNPDSFTYNKYCGKVGISTYQIFGLSDKLSEDYIPLGWCDSSKLKVRPKDGIAIMLWSKEFKEEIWCHVSKESLDTWWDEKNTK